MFSRLALTTTLLTLCACVGVNAADAVTVVRVEDLEKLVPEAPDWLARNSELATLIAALLGAAAGSVLSYWLADHNAKKSEERSASSESSRISCLLRLELSHIADILTHCITGDDADCLPDASPDLFVDLDKNMVMFKSLGSTLGYLPHEHQKKVIDAYGGATMIRAIGRKYSAISLEQEVRIPGAACAAALFPVLVAMHDIQPLNGESYKAIIGLKKAARIHFTTGKDQMPDLIKWLEDNEELFPTSPT